MNVLILLSALLAADPVPRPAWLAKVDRVPAPAFEVLVPDKNEHTAKPTVKPMVLNHNYRTTSHQQWCMMCLGQHLRNMHGERSNNLDKVGYRDWVRYHEGLHDRGTVVKQQDRSRPTYRAPQQPRQRRGLICRLRGG